MEVGCSDIDGSTEGDITVPWKKYVSSCEELMHLVEYLSEILKY